MTLTGMDKGQEHVAILYLTELRPALAMGPFQSDPLRHLPGLIERLSRKGKTTPLFHSQCEV